MTAPRPAVILFVRAPRPGRVKTRLAADLGEAEALRLYRRMGRGVADEARALAPGATIRVQHAPAGGEAEVREWLGEGLEFRSQAEGDLGRRLRRAFEEAFADGLGPVVVVGSDVPDLRAPVLRAALARLERHRAVVGPSRDGGYYLVGLREQVPGIFRDIPWSTGQVLEATLDRFSRAGVAPALLPALTDVDRAADLPPAWRSRPPATGSGRPAGPDPCPGSRRGAAGP